MTALDLRVSVWKKATSGYRLLSRIHPDVIEGVSLGPRLNTPGTWSLTTPWAALPQGFVFANLLTFDVRGTRETCRITSPEVSSDETGMPLSVLGGVTMDSILGTVGWPNPNQGIDTQDSVRWYREGIAEDVLSDFLRLNLVNRLGYDLRVMPSQGRGPTITVNSEFANMLEVVQGGAMLANLRLRVGLVETTSPTQAELRVWFESPVDRSKRGPGVATVSLSHVDGNLSSYRDVRSAPTATRAIVQAAREKQGRQILSVNATANTITTAGDRRTSNREVQSVNATANTITTKSAHKMQTGATITFTGGNPPAPLTRDGTYYAIKVDSDTLRVANTRAAALAGNNVTLTNAGSGQIVVTKVTTRPIKHRLKTGDVITFSGDTPPEPLDTDMDYHAVRVDDNTFAVALTRSDAHNNIVVDLIDGGEGDVTVTESTRRLRLVTKPRREETWGGWVFEVFVEGNGEDGNRGLDQQGEEALQETGAERGVELEAEEVAGARYGDPLLPGDSVGVRLPNDKTPSVEVIGGADITATSNEGLVVKLLLGAPELLNPLVRQATDIRRVKRRVRRRRED